MTAPRPTPPRATTDRHGRREAELSPTRRIRTVRTALAAAVGVVVLTTCAVQDLVPGDDPASQEEAATAPPPADDAEDAAPAPPPAASCDPVAELDPAALSPASGAGLTATEAVTAGLACAERVVVVPADDPALAAVAVPLAVRTEAPLLVGDVEELAEPIAALGDPEVRVLGRGDRSGDTGEDGVEVEDDGASDAGAATASAAAVSVELAEELGVDRFVAVPADAPNLLTGAAELARRTDAVVLPVGAEGPAPTLPDDAEVVAVGDVADQLPDAPAADEPAWRVDDGATTAWLVDPADPAAAATVVLAALRGETVVPVSDGDLLGGRTVGRVRGAGLDASALVPVGAFTGDPARQVPQLAEAPLLPGGSLRLFEGTRMVAVYGHPGSSALGVLGEQDLDATVERVREVGAGYDADGRDVVPTFEIIASIASSGAGEDGSYSRVTPPEEIEPWVERAAEEGFQVILDLQPGRTDFLTQARVYEDLLRQPHVGLALDPEWRLEDDQVHLEQIGGVDAAEVQQVVDWLAELTREEGLTSKLLVLHQFRLSMLRDRDRIEVPPEIAAVVHADGQGPQAVKLATWRTLTAGAEDRWLWGWKNFYDEDPVVAEPEDVLALEPDVVLVTFQ